MAFNPPSTANSSVHNAPGSDIRQAPWLFAAVAAAVLAVVIYVLLPLVGIESLANQLSFKKIFLLGILFVGGTAYWYYLDGLARRPWWLLYAVVLGLPVLEYVTNLALQYGVNLYKTVWIMGGILTPIVWMCWPHLKRLWRDVPYFRFWVVYVVIAGLFYVFNNRMVFDQRFSEGSQPISFHAYVTSIFHTLMIVLTGCAIYSERRRGQVFQAFNKMMIVIALVFSIVPIVTYPLHIFTEEVEEVHRTRFLFLFTNEYAFYMEFLTLYLMGVFFYQLNVNNQLAAGGTKLSKMQWLCLAAIILSFLGMLTSFTKTAIASIVLVGGVMLFFNLQFSAYRGKMFLALLLLPILGVLGALGVQAFSGINFMEGIIHRMENTDSMTWRENVWNYLMYDIDLASFLFGHGFSASSERMSIFERFMDIDESSLGAVQTLHVHNSYLSQLYDFGIAGVMLMIALAVTACGLMFKILKNRYADPGVRALDIAMVSLIGCYLILCGYNNTFDMMQMPFWIMLTVLYLTRRTLSPQKVSSTYVYPE